MVAALEGYLNDLGKQLRLKPVEEKEIIQEIKSHVEERARELIDTGVPQEEAFHQALKELGHASGIARGMYSVHSLASWKDTSIAVLPHLLFSLLFAFHLWTRMFWVVPLLLGTALVGFRGWKKGRPNWAYPWLGYCLVAPAISWVVALVTVGYGAWSFVTRGSVPIGIPLYIASFVYLPISLWFLWAILSRVIRIDWLLASLTVLPFPFLAYWLLYVQNNQEVLQAGIATPREADSTMALIFISMAVVTAVFMRVAQRLVRVGLLVLTTPCLIILAWMGYHGGPGYVGIFLFSAASVLFLLSPSFMESHLKFAGERVKR